MYVFNCVFLNFCFNTKKVFKKEEKNIKNDNSLQTTIYN